MKIIDIAMCVDNQDPQHMGRIRINRYNTQTGEVEGAFNITEAEKWSKKDLFVASPFLPTNVNFIPEIGQSVKIINYNTDKDFSNQEYIAGPFTTMSDYNGQTHLGQLEFTSYGGPVKRSQDVVDKIGNYLNKKSKGSFAKHNHYGVYGKYGSDLIFTDNGLMLRGGKFIAKDAASGVQKKSMVDRPIMSNKTSNVYLKKFPTTKKWTVGLVEETNLPTGDLKYMVEYELSDSLDTVSFYVYKLKPDPEKQYRLENAYNSSAPLIDGYYELVKNIPPFPSAYVDAKDENTTLSFTGTSIEALYRKTNDFLQKFHTNGLVNDNTYGTTYFTTTGNLHPYYFRPTKAFQESTANNTTIKQFLDGINVFNIKEHGLIYSPTKITPNANTKMVEKRYITEENEEQTFAAIKSDQVFFLSTMPTKSAGATDINFDTLDKYELTQDEYVNKIWPNTFASVRGETLLEVLQMMFDLFASHKHDILEPLEQSDDNFQTLKRKLESLEEEMLNHSIRIN